MKVDNQLLTEAMNRRRDLIRSKECLPWAMINIGFAILLTIDFYNGFISELFANSLKVFITLIECLLITILTGNAIFDLIFYSWPYFWMKPIPLTEEQRRLFGIKENELGFTDYIPVKDNNQNQSAKVNDTKGLPQFSITPEKKLSPFNIANTSANRSLTTQTQQQSPNTSYFLKQQQFSSTPNTSLNQSSFIGSTEASWSFHAVNNSSPYLNETNISSTSNTSAVKPANLRKRSSVSYAEDKHNSSFIKDETSLREYLYSYEEMEEKMNCVAKVDQQQSHYFPLNQSCSPINQSPVTSVNYQAARDVTTVANPKIEEISSIANLKAIEDFANLLNTNESKLYKWIENIRSWISQTILTRVNSEIDRVNEILSKSGLSESLIGEIGLSSLKQLSTLKSKEIPMLATLVPYLDISLHQEYLVQRIKDLAKGGCMSEFNWNKGTYLKGKPWSEELPTDAQIVMNLFCAYLDSRLPPTPNCPNGKPFSETYFKSSLITSTHNTINNLYISQVKSNPPHYNVVVDGVEHEIPTGRNNIFYALIYFLYIVKTKKYGLLGRVNLGPSGVNILWTIMA